MRLNHCLSVSDHRQAAKGRRETETKPTYSHRRPTMPLLQVRLIKGVFNKDQKTQMIRKLTDTMVSIEGENMRPVTWVTIEEVESGEWGIGGNALTTADVHALAAGKAA
jgi:4-oxalocrotonate tautomerase